MMPYRRYLLWRVIFLWPWTLMWFAVLMAVILWQAARWLTYDQRQPVQFERTEILNSPVRPGDALVARVWREKVRDDCPITSARTAINQDGEITDLGVFAGPGGPASAPYVDVLYPIPPDLPDGAYTLREMLTYHCPRGLTFDLTQPLAPFRVRAYPDAPEAPPLGAVPPGLASPEAARG